MMKKVVSIDTPKQVNQHPQPFHMGSLQAWHMLLGSI